MKDPVSQALWWGQEGKNANHQRISQTKKLSQFSNKRELSPGIQNEVAKQDIGSKKLIISFHVL